MRVNVYQNHNNANEDFAWVLRSRRSGENQWQASHERLKRDRKKIKLTRFVKITYSQVVSIQPFLTWVKNKKEGQMLTVDNKKSKRSRFSPNTQIRKLGIQVRRGETFQTLQSNGQTMKVTIPSRWNKEKAKRRIQNTNTVQNTTEVWAWLRPQP